MVHTVTKESKGLFISQYILFSVTVAIVVVVAVALVDRISIGIFRFPVIDPLVSFGTIAIRAFS